MAGGMRRRRDVRREYPPCACQLAKPLAASLPSQCGRCARRPPSTPPGWMASQCGPPTRSGQAKRHRCCSVSASSKLIDTGDPLPAGYDAVVMREHVHHTADGRAELRAAVPPYQHVRTIGEDISASELLLPVGHRLRPVDVAACAAAGATELVVRRRPKVVIVPTGDEIRPVGTDLAPGEIVDTNSLMLAAQAGEIGCDAQVTAIVGDDPHLITDALRDAAVEADLVILIAGSSAGRDDYTARVVAEAGSLAVHGVAVKPGHPVVLGTVAGAVATPVLGAPGYPVSAALTFDIFAAPMLAALEGTAPRERSTTHGTSGSQACFVDRHRRLGAGPARSRRRRHHRHPATSRRRRADITGARRRTARRTGGARRAPCR